MTLSIQQQMLIEQRVTNEAKSVGAAYLLWLFLGSLGAHRFYLGRTGTGVAMLLLLIFGFATAAIGIGIFLLIVLGLWAFIDIFLIPGMVSGQKEEVRQRLTLQALATEPAHP